VWKRYLLGQGRGVLGILKGMARAPSDRDLWALRDLSLTLRRGESVAFIGRNGAGKTTALRLIAGISRTTRGRVRTRGRIASLLNVGAGFHRELTGRENVLLNGVILGLSRAETRKRYEQIVGFAGLEKFMDTPLKHFSSGMYARLAFSVAAHSDPDVLLVDEVLSVGDAAFQDRSLRRMLEFRDQGRAAVVFVSHNLAAVELMCPRAVWLDRGVVRGEGATSDVIRAYLDDVDDGSATDGEAALTAQCVEVLSERGEPTRCLRPNESFTVRINGRAVQELIEPVFVVTVRGEHGPLFAGNMHIDGNWPSHLPAGRFTVECCFREPRLQPGRYRVELKVKQNVRTNYFEPRVLAQLNVLGDDSLSGGDVVARWHSAETDAIMSG
jgi:ABC-2 type transport system ATP-binding protein/lipopolysaccharide transport system ATP-binding protein